MNERIMRGTVSNCDKRSLRRTHSID